MNINDPPPLPRHHLKFAALVDAFRRRRQQALTLCPILVFRHRRLDERRRAMPNQARHLSDRDFFGAFDARQVFITQENTSPRPEFHAREKLLRRQKNRAVNFGIRRQVADALQTSLQLLHIASNLKPNPTNEPSAHFFLQPFKLSRRRVASFVKMRIIRHVESKSRRPPFPLSIHRQPTQHLDAIALSTPTSTHQQAPIDVPRRHRVRERLHRLDALVRVPPVLILHRVMRHHIDIIAQRSRGVDPRDQIVFFILVRHVHARRRRRRSATHRAQFRLETLHIFEKQLVPRRDARRHRRARAASRESLAMRVAARRETRARV